MHWGLSGREETAGYQIALGHAAIDAGADILIGHGPHVVQGVEIYQEKPIFYSLSNFYFGWEGIDPEWVGLMVRVETENARVVSIDCSPVRADSQKRTVIRSVQDEQTTMQNLNRLSQQFDTSLDLSGDSVVVWRRT